MTDWKRCSRPTRIRLRANRPIQYHFVLILLINQCVFCFFVDFNLSSIEFLSNFLFTCRCQYLLFQILNRFFFKYWKFLMAQSKSVKKLIHITNLRNTIEFNHSKYGVWNMQLINAHSYLIRSVGVMDCRKEHPLHFH